MRVLVTGAAGMLGQDLTPVLTDARHEVVATDLPELDVRDRDAVRRAIAASRPDAVCHLAALTDVDQCEKDPDAAYLTNTIGTENVAITCRENLIPLLYVSTLSVFDGTKPEPYTEFDRPNPLSHYSNAKYQGELIVQRLLSNHYIVRAGWMFGGGLTDKKFVAKVLDLASTRSSLAVVDDKFGSPTFTKDLSAAITRLIDTGAFGLYHTVNAGPPISRFEFAQHILRLGKVTGCTAEPVSSAAFPLPAPRPRMEAARNLHLELLGWHWMRPWEAALADYIESVLMESS